MHCVCAWYSNQRGIEFFQLKIRKMKEINEIAVQNKKARRAKTPLINMSRSDT